MKKIKPLKYDMKLQFTNYAKKMYPSFCWKYKFSLKIFFILVKLANPRTIRLLVLRNDTFPKLNYFQVQSSICQWKRNLCIMCKLKLEAQWAEPVWLTCWTNQKQELPMVAMFVNGLKRNEQSLERTFHRCFLPSFSSCG
jgi:hypothetical protein